jgi:subtilisin family serine protease
MDPVTSAEFLILKDSFARKGVNIAAAYTPAGEIDYIYVVDRLLTRSENVDRLQVPMPELRLAADEEQPATRGLVRLSTDQVTIDGSDPGALTVPELLDEIDQRFPDLTVPADEEQEPLMTPVHVVYITKITPFGEPELPGGATGPWPPQASPGAGGVKIGISDTGLQPNLTVHSWMTNVTGDPEPLGALLPPPPQGLRRIPPYAGHGTFTAGVAKCTAPDVEVYVNNHFTESEGEAEDIILDKLDQLITTQNPDVVCLPAGLYTRNNSPSLPFNQLHQMHPDLTLVASAGNDSKNRKFYPAAYPWAIGVGALATGQQSLASFSNFGPWVDVYALGQNMINAYAFGKYFYQVPSHVPSTEIFNGIARWSGTSFSAPLVAGLIAREMAQSGSTAAVAAQTVLNNATMLSGVGPAVFPPP